ncbi:hypothetical protein PR048_006130 [Dryococelus australis]|uniref:PiggyBac transposable element-derived protein domain-containing protein n=1 Tax=Dryococelus australis TaxID=614101 RepID=A0ABQ9IA48_9NEOP|nr:hypothetical protein PR048_006130 [Dryococelus australis]
MPAGKRLRYACWQTLVQVTSASHPFSFVTPDSSNWHSQETKREQYRNASAEKREIPEKTSKQAAPSGTISTCENLVAPRRQTRPVYLGERRISSISSESEDERIEDSDADPDWLPDSSDSGKKRTLAAEVQFIMSDLYFLPIDESSDESNCAPEPKGNCARNLSTRWHGINKNASEKPQPIWYCSPEEPPHLQSPIDYFHNWFSSKLPEHIVDQSNLYSTQRDSNNPLNTNVKEFEQFLGICVYMSIFGLRRSRMYWTSNTCIDKIQAVMYRSHREQIKNSIHFNDNSCMSERDDAKRDKLFKIRSLIVSLKYKFNEIPLNDQQLCVDEQIIPFKGRSVLKQYNPKKPYKWVTNFLSSVISILYSVQIMPVPNLPDLGASSNFILRSTQMIPENKNFLVYFDNGFALPRLFVTLTKKGVGALDTVRLNKFRGLTFTADNEMKKKGRGTFEEKETTLRRIDVGAVKWFDNRAIPYPRIVRTYNEFTDGVYLLDSLITYYRIMIRSKKFYLQFFFSLCGFAWLLYREDCKGHRIDMKNMMDLLEFRADIAESLRRKGKEMNKRDKSSPRSDVEKNYKNRAVPVNCVHEDEKLEAGPPFYITGTLLPQRGGRSIPCEGPWPPS